MNDALMVVGIITGLIAYLGLPALVLIKKDL